jgi:hypothetical protein
MGKTRPKSPGKIREFFFFSKDVPLIHFIHPKVQKYIQKCLKIAPNVIKINNVPNNSFIQTYQKYLKIRQIFGPKSEAGFLQFLIVPEVFYTSCFLLSTNARIFIVSV